MESCVPAENISKLTVGGYECRRGQSERGYNPVKLVEFICRLLVRPVTLLRGELTEMGRNER